MEEQIVKILEKLNGFIGKVPGLYVEVRNQFLTYEFTNTIIIVLQWLLVLLVITAVVLMALGVNCIGELGEMDYKFEEYIKLIECENVDGQYDDVIARKTNEHQAKRESSVYMVYKKKYKKWLTIVKVAIILTVIVNCLVIYVRYKYASDVTFMMEYVRNYIPKQ